MALFKKTEEFRQHLPVSAGLKVEDLTPFIIRAENEFIIPWIGQELYDFVHNEYKKEVPNLSEAQSNVLEKIRPCLAAFALYLYIPFGQTTIDSSGIRIVSTAEKKTAFQWQVNEIEKACLEYGWRGLDTLLLFLEKNKATYTQWAGSDAYTIFKGSFINTADEFSSTGANIFGSRRIFYELKSMIAKSELLDIKPILGSGLYDEIKAQILDGNLTDENATLLQYIQKALAYSVYSSALPTISTLLNERGISLLQNQKESAKEITDQRLSALMMDASQNAFLHKGSLRSFLEANASTYELYTPLTSEESVVVLNNSENKFLSL